MIDGGEAKIDPNRKVFDGLVLYKVYLYNVWGGCTCRFFMAICIVLAWETKICDVNYSVLVQYYGFQTSLLDVTNDVRTAFFATCR